MTRLAVLAAVALAAGAASPPAPLPVHAGLWRVTNLPGSASLDGRPLTDLPVSPPTAETICLAPAEAQDAIRWIGGDLLTHCTLEQQTVRGDQLDVAGRCVAEDQGQASGHLRLVGKLAPTRYALRFDTVAHGENGTMEFTGRLAGERIGDCPAARP